MGFSKSRRADVLLRGQVREFFQDGITKAHASDWQKSLVATKYVMQNESLKKVFREACNGEDCEESDAYTRYTSYITLRAKFHQAWKKDSLQPVTKKYVLGQIQKAIIAAKKKLGDERCSSFADAYADDLSYLWFGASPEIQLMSENKQWKTSYAVCKRNQLWRTLNTDELMQAAGYQRRTAAKQTLEKIEEHLDTGLLEVAFRVGFQDSDLIDDPDRCADLTDGQDDDLIDLCIRRYDVTTMFQGAAFQQHLENAFYDLGVEVKVEYVEEATALELSTHDPSLEVQPGQISFVLGIPRVAGDTSAQPTAEQIEAAIVAATQVMNQGLAVEVVGGGRNKSNFAEICMLLSENDETGRPMWHYDETVIKAKAGEFEKCEALTRSIFRRDELLPEEIVGKTSLKECFNDALSYDQEDALKILETLGDEFLDCIFI